MRNLVRQKLWGGRWLAVVALVGMLASSLTAAPAQAESKYPSWDDIKSAQSNEAAKKSEIQKITVLINDLTDEYLAAQADAQTKLDEYDDALTAYSDGLTKYQNLQAKAAAAKTTAEESKKKAGALVAQMYRSSGTDLSLQLLLSGGSQAQDLLYKLSALGQITDTNYQIYESAINDANLADSLSRDAEAASNALADLEGIAKQKYAEAETAQQNAAAALQAQEDNEDRLYEQLAVLENSTASLIKERQDGIKKEKEEAARKAREEAERKRKAEAARKARAEKAAAAAEKNSNGGGGSNGSSESVPPTSSGSWVTPTYGYISSGYGGRETVETSAGYTSSIHNATDIANKCGTKIYAAAAGTVVRTGTSGMAGAESIVINHGGYYTLYLHMQHGHVYVKVGDKVSKGEYIADMGSTGMSTGCHLHFGVYPNHGTWAYWGASVNPVTFMSARGVRLGVG